ncbi:MAG TPA: glycosyltransferase family 39 protein [Chloroflexota bacterium]|jgi:hypothetical protein
MAAGGAAHANAVGPVRAAEQAAGAARAPGAARNESSSGDRWRGLRPAASGAWTIAVALAGLALAVHLATNARYGYFRDELYYLALSNHLDWGYVDLAPLLPLLTKLVRVSLGDSLPALRLLPALAAAARIVLTALLVRELGGRGRAVGLACLATLLMPGYLVLDGFLSMNPFESLFWMGSMAVLVRAVRRGEPRLLLWLGPLLGLGLANKHSTLFFGLTLLAALLISPERRLLRSRWLWLAAAIALLIFVPNLIWQAVHGWPTVEDQLNVQATHKNLALPPLPFVATQVLEIGPVGVVLVVAGLWHLFADQAGRRFRFVGWTFVLFFGLMLALKAKDYYVFPIYPMLFAAGGVGLEQLVTTRRLFGWVQWALPAVGVVFAVGTAPLFLPILPPPALVAYMEAIGQRPPAQEVRQVGPLPQYFGDQFGWPETVETVAQVYAGLPPAERTRAAIFAADYGDAGAIDFFGPVHGLPGAISPHQTYYYWGPGDATSDVAILLHVARPRAEQWCDSVEDAALVGHPYAMAEQHYRILICRGWRMPLPQLWPQLKTWN